MRETSAGSYSAQVNFIKPPTRDLEMPPRELIIQLANGREVSLKYDFMMHSSEERRLMEAGERQGNLGPWWPG